MRDEVLIRYFDEQGYPNKIILKGPDCWEQMEYVREMFDSSSIHYRCYVRKFIIFWTLLHTVNMLGE